MLKNENVPVSRWQLCVASLPVLPAGALISVQPKPVFDSGAGLTDSRETNGPAMSEDRSEDTGWKAGVQLREDQKTHKVPSEPL